MVSIINFAASSQTTTYDNITMFVAIGKYEYAPWNLTFKVHVSIHGTNRLMKHEDNSHRKKHCSGSDSTTAVSQILLENPVKQVPHPGILKTSLLSQTASTTANTPRSLRQGLARHLESSHPCWYLSLNCTPARIHLIHTVRQLPSPMW